MRLHVRALAAASAAAGILLYTFGAVMDQISAWGGAALVSFLFRVDVVQLTEPATLASYVLGALAFGLLFAGIATVIGVGYNMLVHAEPAGGPAPAKRGDLAGRPS